MKNNNPNAVILLIAAALLTLIGCAVNQEPETAVTAPTPSVTPSIAALADTPLPTASATQIAPPTATQTELLPSNTPTAVPSATPTSIPTLTPSPAPTMPPSPTATTASLPTPYQTYSWTLKVPILMYHYISVPPPDADQYRIALSVTPDLFREQMTYLADNGFTPIDLYDLSLAIANKTELPDKPIVITLDDGYRDNYENAFSILQEFGFTATFFLATNFIDSGNPAYMTWEMIEEMAAAGMRMEPHSKSHPDMTLLSRDGQIFEALGSRETIESHIGVMPRFYAYPSGRYDAVSMEALESLGFWGAVTTQGGTWHGFEDRYEWTRIRVRNDSSVAEIAERIDPKGTIGGKQ